VTTSEGLKSNSVLCCVLALTFLSKKSTGCQQKIVLVDSDKILNNTKDVCDTFNTFFVNVANDIGKDITFDESSHPSISKIKANTQHNTLS
jgi:hypothetical protein